MNRTVAKFREQQRGRSRRKGIRARYETDFLRCPDTSQVYQGPARIFRLCRRWIFLQMAMVRIMGRRMPGPRIRLPKTSGINEKARTTLVSLLYPADFLHRWRRPFSVDYGRLRSIQSHGKCQHALFRGWQPVRFFLRARIASGAFTFHRTQWCAPREPLSNL